MARRLSLFTMPQSTDMDVINIIEAEAKLRPNWADVQNRWGLHQFSLGQWDGAKDAFEAATKLNPYYAWASLNKSAALWMMGNREAAWATLNSTQAFQPAKALTAGWMHLLEGDVKAAQTRLDGIAEESQERPDVLWLRTALAETQELDDASRLWGLLVSDRFIMEGPEALSAIKEESSESTLSSLHPGLSEYWKGISTIQARLGKYKESVYSLRLSYIFFSNPANYLNQMARVTAMRGDNKKAMEYYEETLRTVAEDTTAPQELARYHFAQDDIEKAQFYMKIALDRGPNYADLQREMARLEAASGHHKTALHWVQKALSVNPCFKTAQLEEAFYLFHLSRWDEAAHAYRRSLDFNLTSSDVYLHLGLCYEHMEEFIKAESAYKKSIALNTREVLSYYRLSLLYRNTDRPALSQDSWTAYQELVADGPDAFPPDARFFLDKSRPFPEAFAA